MEKKQNYTIPIIVMFLLFFMIAFVTNFAGSMGVIVKNQFGTSNAVAQLGTLANFIAYACMGIPAGIILRRKGYKFTSLLAVTVGFIGVGIQFLSGYAESFAVYVAGALVAGFSMCLLNIVVNPMLNTLGGGGNRGNQLIQWGGTTGLRQRRCSRYDYRHGNLRCCLRGHRSHQNTRAASRNQRNACCQAERLPFPA